MHYSDTLESTSEKTRSPTNGPRPSSSSDLIDWLLRDQQTLDTPVARFAQSETEQPALEPVYRDLIPLGKPGPGEQYAFEVDLDACSGCKACVAACHNLNGLDETETWRDVGFLRSTDSADPFLQTVTTACHHCLEPGCLEGCPVVAYEKDPLTGIVRHLDDQCIGCSYCVLKCPYDVPKYNERLGIVRKCDMCHDRLSAGEAPACVQSCPTQAIRISVVSRSETETRAQNGEFLPDTPDPEYTKPTTRYRTKRHMPEQVSAGDATTLRVQPAHLPLVAMLALTQCGTGLLFGGILVRSLTGTIAGFALLAAGLGASVLHLGQPLRAWRIFLGLRTSWLSREAVLFGLFFPLAGLGTWQTIRGQTVPISAIAGGALLATTAVFASIMIYVSTHRGFWRFPQTALRMGGSLLAPFLGLLNPVVGAGMLAVKLIGELTTVFGDSKPARLQRGPLRGALAIRILFGLTAATLLASSHLAIGLTSFVLGELTERYLFFRAVDAPKMPGVN